MIRKESWPFYRTKSGVRLCWELEKLKGPKGPAKEEKTQGVLVRGHAGLVINKLKSKAGPPGRSQAETRPLHALLPEVTGNPLVPGNGYRTR